MRFSQYFSLLLASILIVCSAPAYAWGDRGHQLIAIVAARLCEHELGDKSPLTTVLRTKELMLGHLANVPDIVWRNADNAPLKANASTHYIGLEIFGDKPTLTNFPRTIPELESHLQEFCQTHGSDDHCKRHDSGGDRPAEAIGTAPFRVAQLYGATVAAWKSILPGASKKQLDDGVNAALLNTGLMAHFVGDLAQPLHATTDYDGYGHDQGGLHAYFESDVINAADLFLVQDVYAEALRATDFAALQKEVRQAMAGKARQADGRLMPLLYAAALSVDSWQHIPALEQLDKQFAVRKAGSSAHGLHVPAERWPASKVAGDFHAFAVQRLALAAQTLAYLWIAAYRAGGEPNTTSYQSYVYPVAPPFVPADYLVTP